MTVDKPLAALITRAPRLADVEPPDLDLGGYEAALHPVLHGAAAHAPYLAGLIDKEGEWLRQAVATPQAALDALMIAPDTDVGSALRRGKRRVALLAAVADLGGAWSLEQVTSALTDYADMACGAALRESLGGLLRRGKLPGLTEDDLATAGGLTVLAMGKMGAGELNYSSDIDLVCLFDETRFDIADFNDARAGLIKATRQMAATLGEITSEGYVFRTDLRLRPDSGVTPVCIGIEAAERYYESLGRTWERAAYIKARPCAGDIGVGNAFLNTLRPFVWRRHLDYAAIEDAHNMRLAIRSHKGLGGEISLPGHDMKLGRGGIREIEFFTQTRQLIAGGRDADLRLRGTKPALEALAQKGWIPREDAQTLADHYTFHRTVEHRLQMVQDAQTHCLPSNGGGIARIAAMMDQDPDTFQAELSERLAAVHSLTEGFFADGQRRRAAPVAHGFDSSVIDRWRSYPALRSDRAAAVFERLRPELLARLSQADRPEEALLALDGFLAGLPAGVQLFSLLTANPQLADLLVEIVTVSPLLADYLSRNAQVLDAVIGGDFFAEWPGRQVLQKDLSERLAAIEDYERQLDTARGWAHEWRFRVGVHHLRGLIDGAEAGRQYAALARAVLGALWHVVGANVAKRHGQAPGGGAVLVGMGSLGARQLTAQSDLDMIVIYDPDGVDQSDGPRPLPTRQYYARLTQAMITAMSAPMAQGRLYEIDLRLRPSGNKGPVATSVQAFDTYQREEAWVWEHLALTRAELVAGPAPLADRVEALRRDILRQPRDADSIRCETAEMRARIQSAKPPDGILDAKIGPGRLQDIELFAQAGALISGEVVRDVPAGLRAAVAAGLIGADEGKTLTEGYARVWALQAASRLVSARPLEPAKLRAATLAFLGRSVFGDERAQVDQIETSLRETFDACAAIIDAALAKPEEAP